MNENQLLDNNWQDLGPWNFVLPQGTHIPHQRVKSVAVRHISTIQMKIT
jgi:hypothetical protein